MANGRARRMRLEDVAGGRGEPGADGVEGQAALLLYIDEAGSVTAAVAPEGAGLHELVAGELKMYTLSGRAAAAVQAAVQAVWAQDPGQEHDRGGGEGPTLTAREWEVLRLVARGLTSEAVARDLGITERPVRYHLTHIYGRLGTSGRAEALAWAVRRGLA